MTSLLNRYTARITELSVVLADLDKGVYQRTMVAPDQKETSGEGKSCPFCTYGMADVFVIQIIAQSMDCDMKRSVPLS